MGKLCVPIVETSVERAYAAIKEAERLADLIELRVDYLRGGDLALLFRNRQKPLIVTNRRKAEGGRYRGEERKRLSVLEKAIDLGADYIDVELATETSFIKNLMRDKGKTQVILSFHDFRRTPSLRELQKLFIRMTGLGAKVIKIVSFAESWEDNLTVLSLIPFAKERRQKIVAFCMGEKGRISRVISPLLGAAWTYASLNRNKNSAPGQLTVQEVTEIWKRMK